MAKSASEMEERMMEVLSARYGTIQKLEKKISETAHKKSRTLERLLCRNRDGYSQILMGFEYVLGTEIAKDKDGKHYIKRPE